jgi:filamentous hemagglutinin
VAGSGIRNFAPAGVTPGSLFLFARAGVINAGDAGIGTAGNAFVDANEFQNFTNTDFGGDVAGFSTDVGGISLSLASVGDVAAGAAKATDKATADAAERDAAAQAASAFQSPAMSIISVEVLGFGG